MSDQRAPGAVRPACQDPTPEAAEYARYIVALEAALVKVTEALRYHDADEINAECADWMPRHAEALEEATTLIAQIPKEE